MSNIFKKADIKAGYLLRVKDDDGDEYNMTVVPCDGLTSILAVCSPEKSWWPLGSFNDALEYCDSKVVAVYGCTAPKFLLDNSTEDRQLLWKRKTEPEPVKMTLAEIAEKLGHPVMIVEAQS